MTTEQKFLQKLYHGKWFYEIVKTDEGFIRLYGPHSNIFYIDESSKVIGEEEYEFVQILAGSIVSIFRKDQILVTDRIL